jgi:hypothetical protein
VVAGWVLGLGLGIRDKPHQQEGALDVFHPVSVLCRVETGLEDGALQLQLYLEGVKGVG